MSSEKIDEEKTDDNMQDFCYKLPKIELHAHLMGSLSKQTLKKLYSMYNPESIERSEVLDIESCQSLTEIFKVFDVAHAITVSPEAVYTATYDTIKEFCDDNVIYLELRSTPREEKGMTKRKYVLSMLRAIETCQKENLPITVKLLLSVNRKQGLKSGKENIQLAIDMSKEYPDIVGIDLSGDPTKGDAFIELLTNARKTGLKIAAHCAEVPNEKEVKDILKFKPDRLGHGTCIHPNLNGTSDLYQALLESKIPVEICLTSNLKCKTVQSLEAHHFKYLYESNHPICLCTDDKGIFNTTLSRELSVVVKYFNLTKTDLVNLMKSTVSYTFTSEETKQYLINAIEKFMTTSKCV